MNPSGRIQSIIFPPQAKVIFGPGSVGQLAGEVDGLSKKRAFVITGTTIAEKTDLLKRVQQILGPRLAGVFYPVSQHVPRGDVVAAAARAREAKADILISLGGSSPVDGAKAVALCLSEGVVSRDELDGYRIGAPQPKAIEGRAIPHIAITTTLSAGEFTSGLGITDEQRQVKEIYQALQLIPRAVILDPEMTISTPPWLWASTAMRAVDHAVERLYSLKHQPLVDTLCIQALRYLFQNLRASMRKPYDLQTRLLCQLAAWMSAIGFISVKTGISHAIGHQLGSRCNVPHGQTSCIMLPHAMAFNVSAATRRLVMVAEAAGCDLHGLTDEQAALAAIEAVRQLVKDLDCPTRLRDVGVKKSDFNLLAEAVMEEAPRMQNPRPIDDIADVLGILHAAR
jgi:alcohol dehydrogenase